MLHAVDPDGMEYKIEAPKGMLPSLPDDAEIFLEVTWQLTMHVPATESNPVEVDAQFSAMMKAHTDAMGLRKLLESPGKRPLEAPAEPGAPIPPTPTPASAKPTLNPASPSNPTTTTAPSGVPFSTIEQLLKAENP